MKIITTITIDTGKKVFAPGEVVDLDDKEAEGILARFGGERVGKVSARADAEAEARAKAEAEAAEKARAEAEAKAKADAEAKKQDGGQG